MKKIPFFVIAILVVLLTHSCVEPLELESIDYENLLVVESLVTNENKHHTVKLSRTFKLDSTVIKKETGALVIVKDDTQNSFTFSEINDGEYLSDNAFFAEVGKSYTLEITTNDGTSYKSTPEKITAISSIDNVDIKKEINSDGKESINFYAVGNNPTNENLYYRYDYDETFKIVAPYWNKYRLNITDRAFPFAFDVVEDSEETQKQICYKTQRSTKVILAETGTFANNNTNQLIRSVQKDNYIISHRYSLLVKQYVQSVDAYNYFKTLSKLSTSQSLFTQSQPGQIASNIKSSKSNDNVIGIFEVSSVSTKRVYINFEDYFPNTQIGYGVNCDFISPTINLGISDVESFLILVLDGKQYIYYDDNHNQGDNEGPYDLVTTACGDCSVLGKSIKPTFWVD